MLGSQFTDVPCASLAGRNADSSDSHIVDNYLFPEYNLSAVLWWVAAIGGKTTAFSGDFYFITSTKNK